MNPKDLVIKTFRQRFSKDPEYLALAPGRVNILGEHVDYNDGFVMPPPSTGQPIWHFPGGIASNRPDSG
ncbi:MAG: galactokinase family protein [Chloroflexota bacterium]